MPNYMMKIKLNEREWGTKKAEHLRKISKKFCFDDDSLITITTKWIYE